MRNTVLGAMGEILIECLNGEGLDKKAKATRYIKIYIIGRKIV